ncbi:MAG: NAD(P)-dependent oxidoreductase [Acidobacteriaceae bacterium]|nr:NAD(P)-dependent oxidoreductase [Acidobacteriaceae bacterium]
MAKPAILVTGGAGYLGSVLVNLLLNEGHSVRVLDALRFGGESLLGCWSHSSFEFVRGDIRDLDAVRACVKGVRAVVHLAAVVGDPACSKQPAEAREVNLDASLRLFDECCRAGTAAFIFASTCSNYGVTAPENEYATEASELAPLSLYAETKVQGERKILAGTATHGTKVVVLRFATLFGASPRMRFDLTVNEFTMQMLTKKHLFVYAAETWRPYIHVLDAARAVCAALNSPDTARGQVYNVGSTAENYRKRDIVRLTEAQLPDARVEYGDCGPDPRNYRVCFNKISQDLGFSTTRTVPVGIAEIIHLLQSGVIRTPDDPHYRNC